MPTLETMDEQLCEKEWNLHQARMTSQKVYPKFTAKQILNKYGFDILKHLSPGERASENALFMVMNSDNFDLS